MAILWSDKKRIFGKPLSFTKYTLYDDKIIHTNGLIFEKEGQILLYRIMDVEIYISIIDKIFGVGTIILYTGDTTDKTFYIKSIKNPREVLSLINEKISMDRKRIGLKTSEFHKSD